MTFVFPVVLCSQLFRPQLNSKSSMSQEKAWSDCKLKLNKFTRVPYCGLSGYRFCDICRPSKVLRALSSWRITVLLFLLIP